MKKSSFFFLVICLFVCCFAFGQNQTRRKESNQKGQNQQAQTNVNSTTSPTQTPIDQPTVEQPKTVNINAQTQNPEQPTNKDSSAESALWASWAQVVINGVLFLVVAVQAFIAWKQKRTMDAQAITMTNQHRAMESQLKFMESQTELMEKGLEETRKALIQNEKAVQVTNRAYVDIHKIGLFEELKVGKPITISIDIINKGNTPALNVKWRVAFDFTDDFEPMQPITIDEGVKESVSFLGKNGTAHMDMPSKERLTNEEMELFKQGKYWVYFWGIIDYKDFFGESHITHFCYFHRFGRGREFDVYWVGNEMD